jgi:primosomal protein N'
MRIQVALSINIFDQFTYEFEGNVQENNIGKRILVPFGNRLMPAWIVNTRSEYSGKVKRVVGIIDQIPVSAEYFSFAMAVSRSYFSSLGTLLDYSLSPRRKSTNNLFCAVDDKIIGLKKLSLKEAEALSRKQPLRFFYKQAPAESPEQVKPINEISRCHEKRAIIGYDRIEQYREICREYLKRDQSVMITVPDRLTAEYIRQHIPESDLYYSQVKLSQRERIWARYTNGSPGILTGGLSAVMLPVENLGCIISERAGSFVYQKTPFAEFDINHLARIRSEQYSLPIVEGLSALTSRIYLNRDRIHIEDRREKKVDVQVSSLTRKQQGLPDQLIEWLKKRYVEGGRILVIMNKKKSSDFLFCRKCRKIQMCPSCGGIVLIRSDVQVTCTRCDLKLKNVNVCSTCKAALDRIKDPSIASLRETIWKKISESGIVSISADDLKDIGEVVRRIEKSRITVATPVLVNPLFKNMFDCIAYFRPESVFSMNEYNTGELIFSMVAELKEMIRTDGVIQIFSVFHFHYALKLIESENDFFKREMKYREWFLLPPFYQVYTLEIKSGSLRKLGARMRELHTQFRSMLNISHVFLVSRTKTRGNYKGKMEIHSDPDTIRKSGILNGKDIRLQVVLT